MTARAQANNQKQACAGGAFTLAESLFALAIVSFTILSIIGIMPNGLTELRTAERRSAEARILQSLADEYQTLPFARLDQIRGEVRYFDAAGAELTNNPGDAIYAARVEFVRTETQRMLPGAGTASPYLRQLRVLITDRPHDPGALGSQERRTSRRREFVVTVADLAPDTDDGTQP